MAIAHVQSTKTHPAANVSATTVAATYPGAVTAGNLLVAFFTSDALGGPSGVSDSVNGAWTAASSNASWAVRGDIYFKANTGAGTPVVTVTWAGAQANRCVYIAEYSGILTSSPNDKNVGNGTATTTTTPTSNNVATPAADGELFFGGLYCTLETVTITAGASPLAYTKRQSQGDGFANSAAIEDAVQTTAAAAAANWTLSVAEAYVCCLSTFKSASSSQGTGAANLGGAFVSTLRSPLFYGNLTST
jgi:hypothetical protein